uniref:Uncharacterized protein n=1 Tax=Arundo donax TaxID=35708 RepID=A0A0A8YQY0_ARUDO
MKILQLCSHFNSFVLIQEDMNYESSVECTILWAF